MKQRKIDEYDDLLLKHFYSESYKNSEKVPRIEWEQKIKKIYGDGCQIIWKDDKTSQLEFGTDLLLITDKGRKYSGDVKTRHQDYYGHKEWLLEIVHHRYENESKTNKLCTVPGWLYKSTSDLIFYGTVDNISNPTKILECVCFSLIPFKNEDFKTNINSLYNGWAATQFDGGQFQLTLNKRVSFDFLKEHANFFGFVDGA